MRINEIYNMYKIMSKVLGVVWGRRSSSSGGGGGEGEGRGGKGKGVEHARGHGLTSGSGPNNQNPPH